MPKGVSFENTIDVKSRSHFTGKFNLPIPKQIIEIVKYFDHLTHLYSRSA